MRQHGVGRQAATDWAGSAVAHKARGAAVDASRSAPHFGHTRPGKRTRAVTARRQSPLERKTPDQAREEQATPTRIYA
jgi:hypothetical protein